MLRTSILVWGLSLLGVACSPAAPPPPEPVPAPVPSATAAPFDAQAVAKRLIIVDGHIDLPHRLRKGMKDGKISVDVTVPTDEGDFDWPRAHAGGLDAPFMSIYVPAKYQKEGGAKAVADQLIDIVEGIAEQAPDKFVLAPTVADVRRAFAEGKIALPMGIENGAAIEGDLTNLKHFHDRGVRYITLTHSEDNDICDSSYAETHTHNGLSELGKQVVRVMNELGIMIDVSHISDDAFWQVMELSRTPVIASHSSCRHFTPGFERNIADDMIERVADGDGVVMINYGSTFVTAEARAWSNAYWEARKGFADEKGLAMEHPEVDAFAEKYKQEHPLPFASVTDVADHIEHVIEVAGIDHVGLGSDFDGVGDSLPRGLEDPSKLPNLLAELHRRGRTDVDLEKIAGENLLRVWAAIEAYAEQRKPAASASR